MIRRARKLPVTIEFVKYLGFYENGDEVEEFLGADFVSHVPTKNRVIIRTLEGELEAAKGDFIIRGVNGEHYPCKPDVFVKTYEEVT